MGAVCDILSRALFVFAARSWEIRQISRNKSPSRDQFSTALLKNMNQKLSWFISLNIEILLLVVFS